MGVSQAQVSYNPFKLSTTREVFSDVNRSWTSKAYQVPIKFAYDLLIKNPFDLTVGNALYLKNRAEPFSKKEIAAVVTTIALGSLYTSMLIGAESFFLGSIAIGAGAKIGFKAAVIAGESLKAFGKGSFLVGTVPLYGTFYALPKFVVTEIPKSLALLSPKIAAVFKAIILKVLFPIAKAIYKTLVFANHCVDVTIQAIVGAVKSCAQLIFKTVLTPLWSKILAPLMDGIVNASTFIGTAISKLAIGTWKVIATAANAVFTHVIAPVASGIAKGLTMVAKGIVKGLTFIGTEVAKLATVVWKAIAATANALFTHVIAPVASAVAKALMTTAQGIGKILTFIGTSASHLATVLWKAVAQAANGVFTHVIAPLASIIAKGLTMVAQGIAKCFTFSGNVLSKLTTAIWQATAQAANAVFTYVISPIMKGLLIAMNGALKALTFVGTELTKVATVLWKATATAAHAVFTYVIAPVMKGIAQLVIGTGHLLNNYIIQPLGVALKVMAQQVSALFQATYQSVLVPAGNLIAEGFRAIGNGCAEFHREISEAIVAVWNRAALLF